MGDDVFRLRVAAARKLRGLNQEELAEKAGMKAVAISQFETGKRKPSFDNLRKLALALQVTSDYLLGRVDDPEMVNDVNVAFRDEIKGLSEDQREMTFKFIEMLKHQSGKKE